MIKRKPASRENSIIIGTILASGFVFVFGFFLGRAWVMIPQEQVDTYQNKSGAPVILAEEKTGTLILPKKKSPEERIIKEKPMDKIKPQKQLEIVQKPVLLPQKQQMVVQKQGTEQKQTIPQVTQKLTVSKQKQQELITKLTALSQKQQVVVQNMATQKQIMPQQMAQKTPAPQEPAPKIKQPVLPQKQQMMVQKPAAQKPVVSQKLPVVAPKPAALPQKQQMVEQKPVPQKQVIPQIVQKPVTPPQKQPIVIQKQNTERKAQNTEQPQVVPQVAAKLAVQDQQKQPQQNSVSKKTEGKFVLQLGSFSDEAKASALVVSLGAKGCLAYKSKMEMGEKGTWYRVYISGVFSSKEEAGQKGDSLKAQGVIGNYFVISSK